MQQKGDKCQEHTLINKQFFEKLLALEINQIPVIVLPLKHSKYDGIVYLMHNFYGTQFVDDDVIVMSCKLLCSFCGTTADGEFRWDLLSFNSLSKLVELLSQMLMQSPNKLYTNISEDIVPEVLMSLSKLIQESCLHIMPQYRSSNKVLLASTCDLEANVVKILCLPFAIDMEQSLFYEICCSLHKGKLLQSLVFITRHNTVDINVVVGLIARLVLTDEMFASQIKNLFVRKEILDLLPSLLFDQENINVLSDMLAVLSHLSRQSPDSVAMVTRLFVKDKGIFYLFIYFLS